MSKSMTGFGRFEKNFENRSISIEMKSVNHKYADINIKVNRKYTFLEEHIRKYLKEHIQRGKVEVYVVIEDINLTENKIELNEVVAKEYFDKISKLNDTLGIKGDIPLEFILEQPDVIKLNKAVENEEEILEQLLIVIEECFINFDRGRQEEGKKLVSDIKKRGEIISAYMREIENQSAGVKEIYINLLKERVQEVLKNSVDIDEEKILVEAMFYVEKSSITEEIVRMNAHILQLNDIIGGTLSQGKKLDFLMQEMNREINTIGSKTKILDITNNVLNIKSEIEKIREQVQNIE